MGSASGKSHLRFLQAGRSPSGKTAVVSVESTVGVKLGVVRWWAGWRRYVFFPERETFYDGGCLAEITVYLRAMMVQRKAARKDTP